MTFDNTLSKKRAGLHPPSEKCTFEKTAKGIKLPPPGFLGLSKKFWTIGANKFDTSSILKQFPRS